MSSPFYSSFFLVSTKTPSRFFDSPNRQCCMTRNSAEAGEAYIFNSTSTFRSSFHTMAVMLPFILVLTSPHFNFIFCPKLLCIPFLVVLTVPHQFIVLECKSSNNVVAKKKPFNIICDPHFQSLQYIWLQLHE
jgi:hypothetical protein